MVSVVFKMIVSFFSRGPIVNGPQTVEPESFSGSGSGSSPETHMRSFSITGFMLMSPFAGLRVRRTYDFVLSASDVARVESALALPEVDLIPATSGSGSGSGSGNNLVRLSFTSVDC